jgi:hypothetical protein
MEAPGFPSPVGLGSWMSTIYAEISTLARLQTVLYIISNSLLPPFASTL